MALPLRFMHPKRSQAHRNAGLALYKALLTGCKRGGFDDLHTLQITNVIKNRFRQNEQVSAARMLYTVFRAGYQAVDHFDSVQQGDEKSKEYILDLLYRVQNKAKHPPNCDINKVKRGKAIRDQARSPAPEAPVAKPRPPMLTLDERPLPLEKLTGRRHVPRMVSAAGIPMLRLKKPEPPTLGPFIAARLKQRNRRQMRRYELYEQISVADLEDRWDDAMIRLSEHHGAGQRTYTQEPCWDEALYDAVYDLEDLMRLELDKNAAMAEKMHALVEKEKALLLKEREERKRQRLEKIADDTAVDKAAELPEVAADPASNYDSSLR